jgi:hypothetical protein
MANFGMTAVMTPESDDDEVGSRPHMLSDHQILQAALLIACYPHPTLLWLTQRAPRTKLAFRQLLLSSSTSCKIPFITLQRSCAAMVQIRWRLLPVHLAHLGHLDPALESVVAAALVLISVDITGTYCEFIDQGDMICNISQRSVCRERPPVSE